MAFVLDFRRLRYFRAIAAHGSLSAAARVLNIAQPALSHHVGELEASLGLPIFIRTQRGVELTPAGRVLLKHSEIILENVIVAEAELRGLAGRPPSPRSINLAMTPSLAVITPALIAAVQERFPDMTLHIAEVRSRHCRDMVLKGQVDLAITFADSATASALPLIWEILLFVSKPTGHGTDETPISFADLADQPLVLPSQNIDLRQLVEGTAAELGYRLNVAVEIDGLVFRKEAVLAGLGSTVLAFHNMTREWEIGSLVARPIVSPPLRRLLVLESRVGIEPTLIASFHELLQPLLASKWSVAA
jgi:LysR family nitrogen assimilation transcriptional regulator